MIVDLSEILTKLGKASSVDNATLGLINMIHSEVEQAVKDICGSGIEQKTYTHILPAKERMTPRDAFMDHFDVIGDRAVSSYGLFTTADILQLPEAPVRSITSVYEDRMAFGGQYAGAFGPSTLLTQGLHFWLDVESDGVSRNGQLRRIAACWPGIPRTVKVTYVAGYSAAELNGDSSVLPDMNALPIKEAVLMGIAASYAASRAMQDGADGPITERRLGDKRVQYDPKATESGYKIVIPTAARRRLAKYINYARFYGG